MRRSPRPRRLLVLSILSLFVLGAGTGGEDAAEAPTATSEILVTSEAGDKLAPMENVTFQQGRASGTVISVFPDSTKQTIDGIGSSFTESSAFVLAHLEPEQRREVMRADLR